MSFETLARKGARDILYSLEKEGDMNFTELRNPIGSPTTTSQRLNELTELELVKRDVQDDKFRSVKLLAYRKRFKNNRALEGDRRYSLVTLYFVGQNTLLKELESSVLIKV